MLLQTARIAIVVILTGCAVVASADTRTVQVSAERLEDQVRGGLIGQILGNLNGLPHEFKYIAEPGKVTSYVPALPEGARTDDDTDIEWVYVREMAESKRLFLPYDRVRQLWVQHINRSIWSANNYARKLMDLGIEPPYTGRLALNPWANFNISGSFLAESFALAAPAMPQTASRLALHYTHVGIDAEPAQLTQLVATMISVAYVEEDVEKVLDAGVAALDAKSELVGVAKSVRAWVKENPEDWRKTRQLIRDTYTKYGNGKDAADQNGHLLNTAATIAALSYGKGDFVKTMIHSFNFGWDCDNSAATNGSILGVMRGKKWFDEQGWVIKDVYKNTTRDAMPMDETITRFGDRLVACARLAVARGGGTAAADGSGTYTIVVQRPGNVEKLADAAERLGELKQTLRAGMERDVMEGSGKAKARGAYLAICLGEAKGLAEKHPEGWKSAVAELEKQALAKEIRGAPKPAGPELWERAKAAGMSGG